MLACTANRCSLTFEQYSAFILETRPYYLFLYRAYLYSLNESLLKTKIDFITFLFERKYYPLSFILKVIDKFKNKFDNHNKQLPADPLTIQSTSDIRDPPGPA